MKIKRTFTLTEALNELSELNEADKFGKYEKYEGRPLTEKEILLFLDGYVERKRRQWGDNSSYAKEAEEYRDEMLERWRNGQVIAVDHYEYIERGDAFGETLYSDGTVEGSFYGYSD